MSNMLKCPNPSCPYVFDPSQVPVGVVLSCPRCAMQFTLGAPAAAPPSTTAAYPPHQPQAPFPPTEPDIGALVRPSGTTSRVSQRATRGERSRDRQPAGGAPPADDEAPRGNFQVFAIAGVVAVLLAGAAIAVVFTMMRRGETEPQGDIVSRWPDYNAGVEALPPGWTRDDTMRVKVGSPYVVSFKRENPEAYVAFGANTFGSDHKKGRNPRPSEMRADLMKGLSNLFIRTTGDDSLRPEDPLTSKWLGEPVAADGPQYPNGFSFRAKLIDGGTAWRGEAYTVAHKGLAYYWMGWCPEENFDGLKAEFQSFRDKFRILELRKEWAPTQASVTDYKGDKVPYTFSDAEDVWKEAAVTDDERKHEPDLDKLLRLRITPRGNRHALPDEAELRVYVVESGGDPTETAREYAQRLETDRVKLLNPDFRPPTFEILTDAEQGDPIATTAPRTATIVRMRSKLAESRDASRLYVISGVRSGDKLVVLRCWCEWSKRGVLEARLTQIASSLRP
jgi:hypothetical protein